MVVQWSWARPFRITFHSKVRWPLIVFTPPASHNNAAPRRATSFLRIDEAAHSCLLADWVFIHESISKHATEEIHNNFRSESPPLGNYIRSGHHKFIFVDKIKKASSIIARPCLGCSSATTEVGLTHKWQIAIKNLSISASNFCWLTVLNNLRPSITMILIFWKRLIADLTYLYQNFIL